MDAAKLTTSSQDPTSLDTSLEQHLAALRLRYKAVQSMLKVHCTTAAEWGRVVRTLEKLAADFTRQHQGSAVKESHGD